ncbi:MAG: PAS domain-containing protein, partial [Gemmatimonadales bacterium]
MDSLDAGVVVLGPDGRIVEWTSSATRLTGVAVGLALGRNFWAAFPAIRTTEVEQAFEDVAKDGVSRRLLVAGREEELSGILFEFQIARSTNQGLTILFHRVRDGVGGRIAASHGRADDQVYIEAFDALPVAALLVGPTGVIIDANPVAAGLLRGPTPRALRGRTLVEWFDDATLQEALAKAEKFPTHLSTFLETGSAGPREIQGVLAPLIPGAIGSTLLFTATDVSREQVLQKKLTQAGRLSQLGALVAGVAHELNNPLAAISAFADAVASDARQTDLIESAAIIHAEAVRAGRIVRTLLDYAHQRRTALGPVNLRDTMERVLALQGNALRKSGVRVDLNIASDFPPVRGDSQELQQVFLNGVVNAQQALAGTGGKRVIEIGATLTDGAALVTIDDTGSGVPPELIDQVFD